MKQDIFCIISAISNNYGVFSFKEKQVQLLNTIKSINNYAHNSEIVLIEASETSLPTNIKTQLKQKTNLYIEIFNDPIIQHMKYSVNIDTTSNQFIKKTMGEIRAFWTFLEILKHSKKKYKRVFKIAGRYKLNTDFNIKKHYENKKFILFKEEDWGEQKVFATRLWSFDFELLNDIYNLFEKINFQTLEKANKTSIIDIFESTLHRFINELKMPYKTISPIGVEGMFGQDGEYIKE